MTRLLSTTGRGRVLESPTLLPIGIAAGALVACATVAFSDEGTTLLPSCLFRAATGLDCPLCGATRGMRQLLRGNLSGALDHNVLLLAVVPIALVAYLNWAGPILGLWRARLSRPPWAAFAITATLIVFGVARNLPFSQLHWLRSTA